MRKFLAVAWNEVKRFWSDKGEVATLFLMPLAFILPISFALGGGDGYGVRGADNRIGLPVVNYDPEGAYAVQLLNELGESLAVEIDFDAQAVTDLELTDQPDCVQTASPECQALIARTLVEEGYRVGMLVIPPGFSDQIEAGENVTLSLIYDATGDAEIRAQLEGVIQGAAVALSLDQQIEASMTQMENLAVYAPEEFQESITTEPEKTAPEQEDQPAAIRLVRQNPSSYQETVYPDTYQQTIPGYTVMYLFFIIGFITNSINQERFNGTFRRLMTTPVSKGVLLGGKVIMAVGICMLQVAVMFGIGKALFGLDLGADLLALALLTLALSFAAAGIGLAASTVTSNSNIFIAPLVLGALLGGCMFPRQIMPPFLRTLGLILPHGWALEGYQTLMVRGGGLGDVALNILVLAGFGAVFMAWAVLRGDFEREV